MESTLFLFRRSPMNNKAFTAAVCLKMKTVTNIHTQFKLCEYLYVHTDEQTVEFMISDKKLSIIKQTKLNWLCFKNHFQENAGFPKA